VKAPNWKNYIETNRDSSDVLRFSRREIEKSDGDSSTQRATGLDTDEGMEERVIRVMPIVTTLSFVRIVKDKERGVRVTLTCYNYREYDVVKNHKRHQFTSRKSAPRCTSA
jgi:hypothetical protein